MPDRRARRKRLAGGKAGEGWAWKAYCKPPLCVVQRLPLMLEPCASKSGDELLDKGEEIRLVPLSWIPARINLDELTAIPDVEPETVSLEVIPEQDNVRQIHPRVNALDPCRPTVKPNIPHLAKADLAQKSEVLGWQRRPLEANFLSILRTQSIKRFG